jgi:hypothetical protein
VLKSAASAVGFNAKKSAVCYVKKSFFQIKKLKKLFELKGIAGCQKWMQVISIGA